MGPSLTNLASVIGLQNENGEIVGLNLEPVIASLNQSMGTDFDAQAVSHSVTEALKQALSTDIGAILGESWKSVGLVGTALKETAKSKKAQAIVPLSAHKIQTSLEPQISLLRDGLLNIKLPFDASLTFEIKDAEILILGGKLSSFKLGNLIANGALKFAGQTVFKINPKIFEHKQTFKFENEEIEKPDTTPNTKK